MAQLYNTLRSYSKQDLVREAQRLSAVLDQKESSLLELAQNLALANEKMQIEYEKQTKLQEDLKKTQNRIAKIEQNLMQELKDKDLIIEDYNKLTLQKEQLIKKAKRQYSSQIDQKNIGVPAQVAQPKQQKQPKKLNPSQTKVSDTNSKETLLFQQSEDAFKELMKSSYVSSKKSDQQTDEFGLSNIKYDPLFK